MRVCIIGNSHIGVLKKAWLDGLCTQNPGLDLTFFGAQRDLLRTVQADDGRLRSQDKLTRRSLAMTTGLKDPDIRVADFDCVLLHGLVDPNWVVLHALSLFRHRNCGGAPVSSGLLSAVAMERYQQSLSCYMTGVLRGISDVPIMASPKPYWSREVIDHADQGRPYRGVEALPSRRDDIGFYVAYQGALLDAAARDSLSLLPQPPETIVDDYFTAPRFCRDSIKLTNDLDEAHPDDDYGHMNVLYGALVLRDFIGALPVNRLRYA